MKNVRSMIGAFEQKIMYEVGRLIAEKEQAHSVPDCITSILIAYYIENYGHDEKIDKIIEKINKARRALIVETNGLVE